MRILKKAASALIAAVIALGMLPAMVSAQGSSGRSWVGAWSASPVETVVEAEGKKMADFIVSQTIRVILQPTMDGDKVRIHFTNRYGTSALTISSANIAETAPSGDSDILDNTVKPLTVGGKTTFTIPKGQDAVTDPVDMEINALESVAVSYYIPSLTFMKTGGLVGGDAYISLGNQASSAKLSGGTLLSTDFSGLKMNTLPFLAGLDVYAKDAYSVVIIGDSTLANDIPELLAEKFVASGITNIGVLQQAIMGNRLLYDGVGFIGNLYGEAMLERFADDALNLAGVKKIFVKVGINDILHPRTNSMKGKAPLATAEEIIAGYEELVKQAHARGIEIYFFENTPWKGYTRQILLTATPDLIWSEEAEVLCQQINYWIKTNKSADGYINLDSMASEEDPYKLKPDFTEDGVHFTKDAQIFVVDSIPMSYFGLSDSQVKSLSAVLAAKAGEGNTVASDKTPAADGGNANNGAVSPTTGGGQPGNSSNTPGNSSGVSESDVNTAATVASQEAFSEPATEADGGFIEKGTPAAVSGGNSKSFYSVLKTVIVNYIVIAAAILIAAIGGFVLVYRKKKGITK